MSNVYPIKCQIRAADTGVTRVDVYDDIGEGGWFSEGLTAKAFAAEVAGIKGALEVHVNSGGGDVFDGIAISNAIRSHKGDVTTVVDGLAASIASVIAQAGRKRIAQAGSMFMIHDAFGMAIGNAAEMTAMASTLDKVSDNIADVYASRSGRGSIASWRAAMKDETWYTAEEAVAAGLADELGDGTAELPADLDLAALGTVPGRIAARLRTMPQAKASPAPAAAGDDGGDGDAGEDCPTCKGSGKIMQGNRDCPDCDGTGKIPADDDSSDDNGAEDRAPGRVVAVTTRSRVLGIESMPLADKALPVHHTATTDEAWDGPAAVAAMPNDDTVLEYCHAWEDADAASVPHREDDDDADDQKANYKFPHHKTKAGPANLAACRNGLARLSSADIPAGDDAGVKAHLQAHLTDGGGDDDASDHTHHDFSGMSPEQLRAALKGATE